MTDSYRVRVFRVGDGGPAGDGRFACLSNNAPVRYVYRIYYDTIYDTISLLIFLPNQKATSFFILPLLPAIIFKYDGNISKTKAHLSAA